MSGAIPVMLVTGYAGAGKSTLIAQWMVHPEFAEAALVSNILDEGNLDRYLVTGGGFTHRAIVGACACCVLRGRLSATLEELYLDRMHRRIDDFGRIIVEPAGVADPGVILEELASTRFLRDTFHVEGIVTAVDALEAERQLAESREALAQVEVADVLVITKLDLVADEDAARLERRLAHVNPWATVLRSSQGNVDARRIREAIAKSPGREERMQAAAAAQHARAHGHDVRSYVLVHDAPLEPETLRSRLEAFLERHGARVLRLKGLLPVAGQRGPAAVQAVAGNLYPVRLLSSWPQGSHGRLAITVQGVAEAEVRRALEEETAPT